MMNQAAARYNFEEAKARAIALSGGDIQRALDGLAQEITGETDLERASFRLWEKF